MPSESRLPTRVGRTGKGSALSEDPGLRAQLETLTVRLAYLEHEADNWEDSPRPTAEFIRYLRRLGLLPSRIT
jgi:hypothetical protein